MIYKSLNSGQISHTSIPIIKNLKLQYGTEWYDYFVQTISVEQNNILTPIQRFIVTNYIPSHDSEDGQDIVIFNKEQCILPRQIFNITEENITLNNNNIKYITFFKQITTWRDYLQLLGVEGYTVERNIIYDDEVVIGYYIEQIACILWSQNPGNIDFIVSYQFRLDQFKYLVTIAPNEFNMTRNPSAYDTNRVIRDDFTTPYITTIGLYGQQNELLAIAKLSEPIKKSSIISTSIIIQLDYIN